MLIMLTLLISVPWRKLPSHFRKVPWTLVLKGVAFQIVLMVFILKVPITSDIFEFLSRVFVKVISFADRGVEFLFRSFSSGNIDSALENFAFRVLPTIVFFSALMSILYFFGILPLIVFAMGWLMKRTMGISGVEALVAAGNIFVGQTEAPLLVRPYLKYVTKSELLCIMVAGMATIAGGVLASYVNFLGGDSPEMKILFAKHLMSASILSAPAAVVASKVILPEEEVPIQNVRVPEIRMGKNLFEAIAAGTYDGVKLAVNVAAMLLTFIGLIYLVNYILGYAGELTGINTLIREHTRYNALSMEFILGYAGAPIMWLMGIHPGDVLLVGQLLGEKTILNEFYAYVTLAKMKAENMFTSPDSIIIATYILCGFSNFSSIGIQIGGIGALVPEKRTLLSELGIKALIGGTMACLYTASIVRMFL